VGGEDGNRGPVHAVRCGSAVDEDDQWLGRVVFSLFREGVESELGGHSVDCGAESR
jgi:hypothetical protein